MIWQETLDAMLAELIDLFRQCLNDKEVSGALNIASYGATFSLSAYRYKSWSPTNRGESPRVTYMPRTDISTRVESHTTEDDVTIAMAQLTRAKKACLECLQYTHPAAIKPEIELQDEVI